MDDAPVEWAVGVSCVGDSITVGFGLGSSADTYPAQLGKMLGPQWAVSNFGGSGATALKNGNNPYYRYSQFADALDSGPDVVVIMLGANDANPVNWPKSGEFKEDYRWLIQQFRALPSNPRVFICRPCFAVSGNGFGILESNILLEIPWINELADEERTGLIDNHAITQANPSEMPGGQTTRSRYGGSGDRARREGRPCQKAARRRQARRDGRRRYPALIMEIVAGKPSVDNGMHIFAIAGDGVAFDKVAVHSGMGSHLMNYRARMIGAEIVMKESAGGSCRIICRLPTHDRSHAS